MALVEITMPKMGESITEATIIEWSKKVGEPIALEETLLEIATDKVESEIPSPVEGIIAKILFDEGEAVEVGSVIAIVESENSDAKEKPDSSVSENQEVSETDVKTKIDAKSNIDFSNAKRFYSPLVKKMAAEENVTLNELDSIKGSGAKGRVNKVDMLGFIQQKKNRPMSSLGEPSISVDAEDSVEIIEMDRMRQLIADHMVQSKQTSPHVTSFLEIDVTNIVNWRNSIKTDYEQKYEQKITFTPVFVEAVVKAIQDFPLINSSVEGKKILKKKHINIGIATALANGNLIVPIIKNAVQYDLKALAQQVNDLANRARNNKLLPTDTQNGTFTLTNVGTFGNTMGTPIINQPQVAILSTGAINKKPAVLETEYGDIVAVRHRMFLSLSYDHRIVDGKLGGSFLRRVGDYLEGFEGFEL